jgi:hypothetical protein
LQASLHFLITLLLYDRIDFARGWIAANNFIFLARAGYITMKISNNNYIMNKKTVHDLGTPREI